MVILPDYQGIGLGIKFLEEIAKMYMKQGFDFAITTTAKNLVNALCKNEEWILSRYGKDVASEAFIKKFRTLPRGVITYTFFAKDSLAD